MCMRSKEDGTQGTSVGCTHLLDKQADSTMHPVLRSAREGELDKLKELLSQDPQSIHMTGIDNQQLMHLASINGHLPVVKFLVEEMKQDPHAADDAGMTALHWAAVENKPVVLKYLVEEAKVDTSCKDKRKGWTAFQWSLHKDGRHDDDKVDGGGADGGGAILYFVESRASDNPVDGSKEEKAKAAFVRAVERSDLPLLLRLFHGGARAHDEQQRPINTLLYVIQQGGSIELIKGLIHEHLVAHEDMLHAAVQSGRADVVTLLLSSSSDDDASRHHQRSSSFLLDINAIDSKGDGETPLTHAIRAGNVEVVKVLMNYGADPAVKDARGDSAISLVSNDMEDQPHFTAFRNSFAMRQVVLGEDVPKESTIWKVYNHEPLIASPPPPAAGAEADGSTAPAEAHEETRS